jgi:hypothetical protein
MNEKFISALIEKDGVVSALILINNEPVLIAQTQFERKKKELVERLKSWASNESGIYACSTYVSNRRAYQRDLAKFILDIAHQKNNDFDEDNRIALLCIEACQRVEKHLKFFRDLLDDFWIKWQPETQDEQRKRILK